MGDYIVGRAAFGPATDCATPVAGASALHVLPVDNDLLRRQVATLTAERDALRAQVEAMRTDISTAHRQIVEGKRTCARDTLAAALAKSTGGSDGQQ